MLSGRPMPLRRVIRRRVAPASGRLDEFRRPERLAHMIVHAGLPETGDLIRQDVGGERNDRHLTRAPGRARIRSGAVTPSMTGICASMKTRL